MRSDRDQKAPIITVIEQTLDLARHFRAANAKYTPKSKKCWID
jgi:hypothetical protein